MIILKKVLSLLLVLCIAIGIFGVNATAADDAVADVAMAKLQKLDIDSNGSISTADASMYLKAAAGIIDTTEIDYDFDADGSVSVLDAQKVLRVVAGVDSPISQEEALALFNGKLNSVKTVRPGFQKTETIQCPSALVTTSGAPLPSLNVTNLEFDKYVDKVTDILGSFMDQSQVNEMKQQAKELYLPQVATKTVAKASNSHYTYFPVNNLGWSSKLTTADIKSATCSIVGGDFVCTVTLGEYTYVGNEYPTGSAGFSKRQALPYGKVFNIASLDESDGSTVNKVQFKNGKVVLKADIITGDVLMVDYSYTYICDILAAPQPKVDMVMKTITTANVTDNYVMNRVTVN